MHIHILGICGTFMGGLALIARSAGHKVTGCDAGVYPPMSTQLKEQGIELIEGFDASQVQLNPDLFIVGNVVSRGNPLMEAILEKGLPYVSGPQWLGDNILRKQHVLAVAGTHGKTTTSSMLAWILEHAGLQPNFLIGGVAPDFGVSARYNPSSKYFVIEADEYDTAFFDKRSKFVHYHSRTAIIGNLEFDHADIFPNLEAIETQFHHLVRTVPESGTIIRLAPNEAIDRVISRGLWSNQQTFGESGEWQVQSTTVIENGKQQYVNHFSVSHKGEPQATISWNLSGEHNRMNALAALVAANSIGVSPQQSAKALQCFKGVKRRMELIGQVNGINVYDDFAHHPTAIKLTLEGARKQVGDGRIIAVLEPRSNTMKLGTMAKQLPQALEQANIVFCFAETTGKHALGWDPSEVFEAMGANAITSSNINNLVNSIANIAERGDTIIIMSNGSFGGLHKKLIERLST